MDVEKISKMLNKGYKSEDSKIAKTILIKKHPELIKIRYSDRGYIESTDLEQLGVKCSYNKYSLYKEDFPELFE